jgi:hypothetical protein
MRFLLGMIVGAMLTVTGAYLHDYDLPGGSNQRLVNWDAAGDLSAWAYDRAREQWTRLVQK